MKKLLMTAIATLLAFWLSMPATMGETYVTQPPPTSADGPLDIEVWTNKEEGATFGQGENLVIYFRANRDCYVTVYDLDTKGDINILYPFDREDDNAIEGGVVYTIPDYYDDFVLRVNGDPGLEFIQAVASLDHFDVPDWGNDFRDPDKWHEIDRESEALSYLEFINNHYFPVEGCRERCDLDYTYLQVRKDWKYAWDSYYDDDYDYYHVHHVYHPYYYRPAYYDPWWDPWDWYGVVYIDYPFGGEIWIDGVFYGWAPLFIPRVCIGWHNIQLVSGGNIYYHDKVMIRRGLSHELYHDGGYKWKNGRRGLGSDDPIVAKYYPKEKSISYRSGAKYAAGGKSEDAKIYRTPSRDSKYRSDESKPGRTPSDDQKYRSVDKTKEKSKDATRSTDKVKSGKPNESGKTSDGKTKDTGSKGKKEDTSAKTPKTKSVPKSEKPSKPRHYSARFEPKSGLGDYVRPAAESIREKSKSHATGLSGTVLKGDEGSKSESRSKTSDRSSSTTLSKNSANSRQDGGRASAAAGARATKSSAQKSSGDKGKGSGRGKK